MKRILILLLSVIPVIGVRAQLEVTADYVGSSDLVDKDGNCDGKGSMTRFNAKYDQTLSCHIDKDNRPTLWLMTYQAQYVSLNNDAGADRYVPDELLNTSLSVKHLRPINDKWNLMAMLGLGLYAMPDDITLRALQVNGGAIFVYGVNRSLDVGIGAGLTNAYGMPGLLPMLYLKWNTKGQYEVDLSMSSGMKLTVIRHWNECLTTRLMAIDMDGFSAVVKDEGCWKVYSTTLMRSSLQFDYTPANNVTLFAAAGSVWRRSSRLTDRKFKNFYKMFSDDNRKHFKPAFLLRVGADIKF